jgi:hypothetical protein
VCLYAAARLQPPDFEHAALLALVPPPGTGAFHAPQSIGGLETEFLAQPVAVGDVHGLQPLELHQQVHSFAVAETLAPALGNDAALTFEVVLASGDVALG